MFRGIFIIRQITASASTFAPSAMATAQASRTTGLQLLLPKGSEMISPVVLSAAVVVSAKGARKQLAPHQRWFVVHEAALETHLSEDVRACCQADVRPAEDTFSRAKGERWTMCPGATRSDSTAMVAAMTRSAPYFDAKQARDGRCRSAAERSLSPAQDSGARPAPASSWVAFTVIHSTSTGGTSEARATGTSKLPNATFQMKLLRDNARAIQA